MVVMLTKISIIIPVFNTASYLDECLKSVLNQTFTDFEIICVNDGSSDSSLDVLKNYQLKDNRIKVISQSNKGAGAARNVGIKYAKGDYILFLDSDDYITNHALSEVYDIAVSTSADMVLFKLINFDNETYETSKSNYFEMKFIKDIVGDNVFSWKNVKNRFFDISITAPGKLIKTNLIKNIRFPEEIIFEDNVFFSKVLFKTKRLYFYDRYLYNRRLRDDSVTTSYYEHFIDCVTAYDLIESEIRKSGNYDYLADQLFNRKCRDIFNRFSQLPNKFKKEYYDKTKENFLKNKNKLESEGTLKICDEYSLNLFNSAINTRTYREFELSVENYNLKLQLDKLRLDNQLLKRQHAKKIYKMETDYKQQIESIKGSTSWKITRIFRVVANFFRRIFSS